MADAFELEEMVVRFTADTMSYVRQVKEVTKVTQDSVQVAKRAADSYATLPVAKRAAETVKPAANASTQTTREYAAQLDKTAMSLANKTAKQNADTAAVANATRQQSALTRLMQSSSNFLAPVAAGLSVGGITSALVKGVGLAAESESIDITFNTIIGDAQKAQAVLKDLRAFADWSPFNTQEVMEASKLMLAMNTPADELVKTMTMLGDVSGALNIPIKDLSYVFGTLRSQGRAFTADINQFATRGIPIWQELSKLMYGNEKEVTQVRAAVEAGQVTFDQVQQAFQRMTGKGGDFFGGMEKQSKSLSGLWATYQSEVDNGLTVLGKTVIESLDLKWLIRQVTDLTKATKEFFAGLTPETKRFLVWTVLAVVGIGGIIAAVFMLGTALTAATGGMSLVVGLIITAAVATAAWASSVGTLEDVWREVVYNAKQFYEWVKPLGPLLLVVLAVVNPLAAAVVLLVMYWKEVTQAVQQFWRWVEPILRELKYTIINIATIVRDALVGAFNWVVERIRPIIDRIKGMFEGVFGKINWTTAQQGLRDFIVFVEFAFSNMGQVADVAWKAMKFGAVAAINFLLNNVFVILAVVAFPALLTGMVVNWREMLVGMAVSAALWGVQLTQFFKDLFQTIIKGIADTIGPETILKILTGQLKVEDVLKDAFSNIGNVVSEEFRKQIQVIKGMKVTMTGIKIEALDKVQADAKKELDDALGKMNVDFGKFKNERNAKIFFDSLKQIGMEAWKAGLAPSKQSGEEAGKLAGQGFVAGLKQEAKLADNVLKNTLEAEIRKSQYLDYLGTVFNRSFNPQLPPGAVRPEQWKPPIQAAPPLPSGEQQQREKMVTVLEAIAGTLVKIEQKPPVLAGAAGL